MEPHGFTAAVPSIPALHPRANARGLRAEADKVQPSQLNFCLNFPAVAKIFRQTQYTDKIKSSLSKILSLEKERIGIAYTSGEKLTAFGRGEGMQCFVVVSIK